MRASPQVRCAMRRLDHWLRQARDHLQRLDAGPKALVELDRLGERLRLETYERVGAGESAQQRQRSIR